MEKITTIGLDIAKHVFQVHGVDAAGAVAVRRKLRRDDVVGFFDTTKTSTSASLSGAIIVSLRYDPVRNVSMTAKSLSITSRTFVCRVETVVV